MIEAIRTILGQVRPILGKVDWEKVQAGALWILGSLFAIALIGDYPYVGLAIAVLSGLVLGLASLQSHRTLQKKTGAGRENEK